MWVKSLTHHRVFSNQHLGMPRSFSKLKQFVELFQLMIFSEIAQPKKCEREQACRSLLGPHTMLPAAFHLSHCPETGFEDMCQRNISPATG